MLSDLLRSLLFPLLLAGGLLAPGWLLGRALGAPAGPAGAVLGSAALLLNLVLALDSVGAALQVGNLAAGLGAICAGLAGIAAWRHARAPDAGPAAPAARGFHWRMHHWLLLPAALGLGAIAMRATLDPLSGFDTYFRWDFLARQMLREGSLHFYPAVSAADFQHYGWCDGIAPLVSSLYAWSYLSLGRVTAWATAPIVLVQAALLFWLVWQLAARQAGPPAGAAACSLLATSAALLWGVALGQETGLTAVCLAAMFWFIEKHRDAPAAPWLVWAGLAAGTGALAREYGLGFIALGAFALGWWRIPRRGWVEFAAAAALVALPWYLRNWLKTGHPLYCHELGGLFPTNPVYREFNQAVAAVNSVGARPGAVLPQLAKFAAAFAGVPLALGVAAGVARWRERGPWLVALLAGVAVWLWSVGLTAGGFVYSLRVLTPAVALGAALAGGWLARAVAARHGWLLAAALTLVAVDAAARSLYLPVDTHPRWWHGRFLAWREFSNLAGRWRAHPNRRARATPPEGRQILVSDASLVALFVEIGAKPVSLLSPAVRFLFDSPADFGTDCAHLRGAGFRFILLMRGNPFLDAQLVRHPFFRTLQTTPPVGRAPLYFVYDLYVPPAAPTPPHAH